MIVIEREKGELGTIKREREKENERENERDRKSEWARCKAIEWKGQVKRCANDTLCQARIALLKYIQTFFVSCGISRINKNENNDRWVHRLWLHTYRSLSGILFLLYAHKWEQHHTNRAKYGKYKKEAQKNMWNGIKYEKQYSFCERNQKAAWLEDAMKTFIFLRICCFYCSADSTGLVVSEWQLLPAPNIRISCLFAYVTRV